MKKSPDDVKGWTMLARSYMVLGRFGEAMPAYAHAAELSRQRGTARRLRRRRRRHQEPRNNPQSMALIERALKVDPKHFKALALAGTAPSIAASTPSRSPHWQKIAVQLPPGSESAARPGDDRRRARQARRQRARRRRFRLDAEVAAAAPASERRQSRPPAPASAAP